MTFTDEEVTPVSEEIEEEETIEEENNDIDYKAELEHKQKQLAQAEFTIKKLKRRDDPLEEEEPTTDIDEIVDRKVKEATQQVQKTLTKSSARALAKARARTDDEMNLIMFHYENSIVLTGDIEEDIENAGLLANKKRLVQENSEIKRALQRKVTAGGTGAGQKAPSKSPIALSPDEERYLRAPWNMTPEEIVKSRS